MVRSFQLFLYCMTLRGRNFALNNIADLLALNLNVDIKN